MLHHTLSRCLHTLRPTSGHVTPTVTVLSGLHPENPKGSIKPPGPGARAGARSPVTWTRKDPVTRDLQATSASLTCDTQAGQREPTWPGAGLG